MIDSKTGESQLQPLRLIDGMGRIIRKPGQGTVFRAAFCFLKDFFHQGMLPAAHQRDQIQCLSQIVRFLYPMIIAVVGVVQR